MDATLLRVQQERAAREGVGAEGGETLDPLGGERFLRRVEVNTVDGFQGREKDVVVFSCVRSSRSIGFVGDERRINVRPDVIFCRTSHHNSFCRMCLSYELGLLSFFVWFLPLAGLFLQ